MKIKKLLSAVLATSLLTSSFLGFSCTAGAAEEEKKCIKVGLASKVEQLSPFAASSTAAYYTAPTYWECLAGMDENYEMQGQLAKSWATDEAELVYDVEIYDYIYDWEGNHITADDVVFCYETAKEAGNNTALSKLDSIEKTGDYSVRMVVNTNMIGTWYMVSSLPIVSQKAYEESSDQMATSTVGTGPYKITDFQPGSSITVEKRDDYWQTDPELVHYRSSSNADAIQYITIPEAAQMAVALETGTIDVATQLAQTSAERFLEDENYVNFEDNSNFGYQLFFSGEEGSPVANNQKLRQAICYAIDVQGIIDAAYSGHGSFQYTLGAAVEGFQEKWKEEDYYQYDPEKAKELLKEAGYKEGELTLVLLAGASDLWTKTSQVIQGYLGAIGINVDIHGYETAMYVADYMDGTKYDMLLNGISNPYVVMNWNNKLNQDFYNGKSISGVVDDELQKLLEGCAYGDNCTPENIDACHQYIKEQAYVYGLALPVNFNIVRKEIGMTEAAYDVMSDMFIHACKYE